MSVKQVLLLPFKGAQVGRLHPATKLQSTATQHCTTAVQGLGEQPPWPVSEDHWHQDSILLPGSKHQQPGYNQQLRTIAPLKSRVLVSSPSAQRRRTRLRWFAASADRALSRACPSAGAPRQMAAGTAAALNLACALLTGEAKGQRDRRGPGTSRQIGTWRGGREP